MELTFLRCYTDCRFAECHFAECRGAILWVLQSWGNKNESLERDFRRPRTPLPAPDRPVSAASAKASSMSSEDPKNRRKLKWKIVRVSALVFRETTCTPLLTVINFVA